MDKENLNNGIELLAEEQVLGIYQKCVFLHAEHLILFGFACLLLIGIHFFINEIVRFSKTKIVITNKRVLDLRGDLFMTKNKTIDLSKLDSSEYTQSLGGKLYNAGDIIISSVDGDQMLFKDIENPINLIETLNAARENCKNINK